MIYQTEHLGSMFIRLPFGQLKALENSSEFIKVPKTLEQIIRDLLALVCLFVYVFEQI